MMVPDFSNPKLTSSPRLFYGPPGTGKSLAAQAIGFEVGRRPSLGPSRGAGFRQVGIHGTIPRTALKLQLEVGSLRL